MMKITRKILFGALTLGAIFNQGCTQVFTLNFKPTVALKSPKNPLGNLENPSTKSSDYDDASIVAIGDQALGNEKITTTYGITNTGDFPLNIQSISLSNSFDGQIKLLSNCAKLGPNEAEICPITFIFDPKKVGAFQPEFNVVIKNNFDEIKTFTFPVEGRGLAIAVLKVFSGSGAALPADGLDFGGIYKDDSTEYLLKIATNTDDFPEVKSATNVQASFNSGSQIFKLSTAGLSPTSNTPPCDLESGIISKDCFVKIQFTPSQVISYSDGFNLRYFNGSGAIDMSRVPLKGSGLTRPTVPDPPTLAFQNPPSFNNLFVPDQGTGTISVRVNGSGAVYLDSISSSAPERVSIGPGSTCPVSAGSPFTNGCGYELKAVTTEALGAGSFSSTITLKYRQNSPTGALQTLTQVISGSARNYSRLAFNPSTSTKFGISALSMGSVSAFSSKTVSVTVQNISATPSVDATKIVLTYALGGPITAAFSAACSSLAPGASCTLNVTFAPTAVGTFTNKIRLDYNKRGQTGTFDSVDSIAELTVSGTGDGTLNVDDGGNGSTPVILVGNNVGNFLIDAITADNSDTRKDYFGFTELKFTGTGTLNFSGTIEEPNPRFSFYNVPVGPVGSFPGQKYPNHTGFTRNVPLCTNNFVVGLKNSDGSQNTSCLIYLGIRDVSSTTPVVADAPITRNLSVTITNASTTQSQVKTFTLKTTPRNGSKVGSILPPGACTSVTTATPEASIEFDKTIKGTSAQSNKTANLCLIAPAYFGVGFKSVEFGTRDTTGTFTADSNSPFSLAGNQIIGPNGSGCLGKDGMFPSNVATGATNSPCPIQFSFKPAASITYDQVAKVTYRTDKSAQDQVLYIKLKGTGSDLNRLTVAGSSNFGTKYTQGPHSITLTVTATGHSPVGPLSIGWPSGWSASTSPFNVVEQDSTCLQPAFADASVSSAGAGKTCTIKFSYTPTTFNTPSKPNDTLPNVQIRFKNALSPNLNPAVDGYNGFQAVTLSGSYQKLNPLLSLTGVTGTTTPYTLAAFPEVVLNQDGGFTAERTFTIQNASNPATGDPTRGAARGFAFSFPTGSGNYSVSSSTCPTTSGAPDLAPGSNCTVTVRFNPPAPLSSPGAGSLSISHSNTYAEVQSPITVNLSGSAKQIDPLSVGASLAFGTRIIGQNNAVPVESRDLVVTNTSTTSIPITAKSLSFGSSIGAPFSVDQDVSKSTCLAPTIGTSGLPPAQICKYSIRFAPSAEVKAYSSNVTFTYRDSAVPSANSYSKSIAFSGSVVKGVRVFAGANRTCVINGVEQAFCFGNNMSGELGIASTATQMPASGTLQAYAQANAINFGSAPVRVRDISIGTTHVCALVDYPDITNGIGQATCWGSGANGKLGKGSTSNWNKPELVSGNTQIVPIDFGTGTNGAALQVLQISAGENHTCALLSNQKIKCFGSNGSGQLGSGGAASQILGDQTGELGNNLPAVGFNDPNLAAIHVSAGAGHSCATFTNGSARCWGQNFFGQLGQEIGRGGFGLTPGKDSQQQDLLAMNALGAINLGFSAGKTFASFGGRTCALSLDGSKVKCFGATTKSSPAIIGQFAGLLGVCLQRPQSGPGLFACNGSVQPADGVGYMSGDMSNQLLAPINFGAGSVITDLAVGNTFACGILSDGSVKCFGYDDEGQLGLDSALSTTSPQDTPLSVPGVSIPVPSTGQAIPVGIAAGANHACLVTNTNELKCWGSSLGNATGTRSESDLSTYNRIGSASAVRFIWKQP